MTVDQYIGMAQDFLNTVKSSKGNMKWLAIQYNIVFFQMDRHACSSCDNV
jgi:hypothetical protein